MSTAETQMTHSPTMPPSFTLCTRGEISAVWDNINFWGQSAAYQFVGDSWNFWDSWDVWKVSQAKKAAVIIFDIVLYLTSLFNFYM